MGLAGLVRKNMGALLDSTHKARRPYRKQGKKRVTPQKLHYIFESATTASPDPLCKNRTEANFRPSKCRRWA